jgi:hypothetical protein
MDAFQKTAATTEKLNSWKNLLAFFGIWDILQVSGIQKGHR